MSRAEATRGDGVDALEPGWASIARSSGRGLLASAPPQSLHEGLARDGTLRRALEASLHEDADVQAMLDDVVAAGSTRERASASRARGDRRVRRRPQRLTSQQVCAPSTAADTGGKLAACVPATTARRRDRRSPCHSGERPTRSTKRNAMEVGWPGAVWSGRIVDGRELSRVGMLQRRAPATLDAGAWLSPSGVYSAANTAVGSAGALAAIRGRSAR